MIAQSREKVVVGCCFPPSNISHVEGRRRMFRVESLSAGVLVYEKLLCMW